MVGPSLNNTGKGIPELQPPNFILWSLKEHFPEVQFSLRASQSLCAPPSSFGHKDGPTREKRSENLAKKFAAFRSIISRKRWPQEISQKILSFCTSFQTTFFLREILGVGGPKKLIAGLRQFARSRESLKRYENCVLFFESIRANRPDLRCESPPRHAAEGEGTDTSHDREFLSPQLVVLKTLHLPKHLPLHRLPLKTSGRGGLPPSEEGRGTVCHDIFDFSCPVPLCTSPFIWNLGEGVIGKGT